MKISRRDFLKRAAAVSAGLALAGCTPQVVKETVIVEKSVDKIVKETVVVEKEVDKIVEKVVTATPAPAPQEATKVRYWIWLDNPDDKNFKDAIADFNDSHPGVEIEPDILPWNQYFAKLTAAIGAGDAPDLAHSHPAWIGTMSEWGVYKELDAWINKWDGKSDVVEGAWEFGRPGVGKPTLAMPTTSLVYYLYVRADMFEEADLDYPSTHEEFLETAKTLSNPDEDRYGMTMRGVRGGHYSWLCWFMSHGGDIFDSEGNVVINSPEAVDANQWYADLFLQHKVVPPSALSDGFKQNQSYLVSGRVAMMVQGTHCWASMDEALGDKVTAIPIPSGKRNWTRTLCRTNAIPKQSKAPEEAFEFLKWGLSSENYHYLLGWEQGLPVLRSALELPTYKENRFFKAALANQESWRAEPNWHPYYAEFAEVAWPTNFQRLIIGEITSQEMMDAFAEGFNAN